MEEDREGQENREVVERSFFSSPLTNPVLPVEVWENTLLLLPSNDFLSSINTCVEWNKLLHSKKCEKLLSLVLPHIMDYLPLNTMLSCRLESHFKGKIDSLLQTQVLDSIHSFDKAPPWTTNQKYRSHVPMKWLMKRKTQLRSFNELQMFLDRTTPAFNCGGNPIVTGYFAINLGFGVASFDEQDNGLTLLLLMTRFGHHISALSIRLLLQSTNPEVTARRLTSILSLVPNLKSLELTGFVMDGHNFPFELLPRLPKLESLLFNEIQFLTTALPIVMPFFHRYGPQITVFSCHTLEFLDCGLEELKSLLPNVRRFATSIHTYCRPSDLLRKLGLMSSQWKLEHLKLTGIVHLMPWSELINTVKMFSNTLKVFEIPVMQPHFVFFANDEVEKTSQLVKLKTLITSLFRGRDVELWLFIKNYCPNVEQIHFDCVTAILSETDKRLCRNAFHTLPKLRRLVVNFTDKPPFVLLPPSLPITSN